MASRCQSGLASPRHSLARAAPPVGRASQCPVPSGAGAARARLRSGRIRVDRRLRRRPERADVPPQGAARRQRADRLQFHAGAPGPLPGRRAAPGRVDAAGQQRRGGIRRQRLRHGRPRRCAGVALARTALLRRAHPAAAGLRAVGERAGVSNRYVCIHGHFYQPPRENPWLEAIDVQDSAYPYHDWNERITAECYATNARSRILDEAGRIARIVNNYERISFNVGPTLLAWLEGNAPGVYAAILDADRRSIPRFDGHGSAIAQAYNHVILPLANSRDRRTQIAWGIADFRRRFGRDPEGMWLPETAVDLESLDLLASAGLAFTILAPHQLGRVRPLGEPDWRDGAGGIDTTMPYRVSLPSGRTIAVFAYNGAAARAVAFERLLENGEQFARRLLGEFIDRPGPQLVHIATDGETYGHHHRFGEMALAYALDRIEHSADAELITYGAYLAAHPPTHEAEIVERTSWSCANGVDRWWTDCGDNSGAHPGWTQAWRTPLRAALDRLRDALAEPFAHAAGTLLRDPWAARDDYVHVILDRSAGSVDAFFGDHAA